VTAGARAAALAAPLLVLAACAALAAPPAPAEDALAPYREFARSASARVLLAEARSAMARYYADVAGETSVPSDTLPWPGAPCGIYVSLVDGKKTRACVGSPTPPGGTMEETVRALALQALSADRRREPVRREELERLRIVISFAGPATTVADPMTVAPAREALLVVGPRGSVAFLPGEAKTVSWALKEAKRIGVIASAAEGIYQRFDVVTTAESAPPHKATGAAVPPPG
jgi:AMMECR1 domain-containing protein